MFLKQESLDGNRSLNALHYIELTRSLGSWGLWSPWRFKTQNEKTTVLSCDVHNINTTVIHPADLILMRLLYANWWRPQHLSDIIQFVLHLHSLARFNCVPTVNVICGTVHSNCPSTPPPPKWKERDWDRNEVLSRFSMSVNIF